MGEVWITSRVSVVGEGHVERGRKQLAVPDQPGRFRGHTRRGDLLTFDRRTTTIEWDTALLSPSHPCRASTDRRRCRSGVGRLLRTLLFSLLLSSFLSSSYTPSRSLQSCWLLARLLDAADPSALTWVGRVGSASVSEPSSSGGVRM